MPYVGIEEVRSIIAVEPPAAWASLPIDDMSGPLLISGKRFLKCRFKADFFLFLG